MTSLEARLEKDQQDRLLASSLLDHLIGGAVLTAPRDENNESPRKMRAENPNE